MILNPSSLAVALAVLVLTGCASSDRRGPYPDSRPLGQGLQAYRPAGAEEAPEFREPTGSLTMPGALAAALSSNPRLAAFSWEVRALDAEILQAGLLPNPALEAELEEFGGTAGRRGLEDALATLRISQLLELGGKRGRRTAVAEFTRDLAWWDYESVRLDVFTETSRAFVAVTAAQRRVTLLEEAHALAQETYTVVSERVGAGKAPPPDLDRSEVLLSLSRIALVRARRDLEIVRMRLSALWGGDKALFERTEGDIEALSAVPQFADLVPLLDRNPDVARWPSELDLRRAELELAEAGATPDVSVQAGIQRFTGTSESAFLLGFGIDIPVFDRNQGAIAAARRRISKAREERRSAETSARAGLKIVHEELSAAWQEADSLCTEVLPAAERAFRAVQEAYQQGKAGYLEVLDAQTTLVGTRSDYVSSLEAYQMARAELERLVAGPLAGGEDKVGGER